MNGRKKIACSTVRADFRRDVWWTDAEAAVVAGVGQRTVYRWLAEGRFRRRLGPTALRVDGKSFLEFLEKGERR